ncbi:hypothetical protein BK120_06665 [Paenibacillus sp. FSL A5-0031]|uniref:hypothetical protein n=1 Tax=Paenibacillus sp. FSL A5-0031 TaxID=1920420 RepID=UPI00096E16B0|nr:hypothetical protein [Paenibacillus sp. FSL A5-0031]OME86620.1 hypothetical protein BK120_06665 [Paenibacillus sp. FSL A5-0031]
MRFKIWFVLLAAVCILSACENNGTTNSSGKVVSSESEEMQTSNEEKHISDNMNEVISNYIIQKYDSVYYQTEKQFEVHEVYGTSESSGIITVYMYSYFGGFNKFSGLENQAGHSLPAVIRLKKKAAGYVVTEYTEPEDGSLYQSSLKKMFPKKYLDMLHNKTGTLEDLQKEMDNKVQQWLDE